MKRVVFVCHEATRTGVPLLLLSLIRWLKAARGIQCYVVLIQGGPLEQEFRQEARVFVWTRPPLWNSRGKFIGSVNDLKRKFANKMFRRISLKREIAKFKPDLIYLNTAAVLSFLHSNHDLFREYRIFLHCHEMPHTLKKYVADSVEYLFGELSGIVVVNKVIEKFFLERQISANRILRVPEYLSKTLPKYIEKGKSSQTFCVIGSGLGSWRKGIDLFVLTASYFSKVYSGTFKFIWIGNIQSSLLKQLHHDAMVLGLSDRLLFIGEQSNTTEYFNDSDVLFLSSREDPYPLVMLEAAWYKKPVIYFDGAGGASEFVNDDELSVPPYDVVRAAERLAYLAEHPDIRTQKGLALNEKVQDHTIEIVGQSIVNFISTRHD